MLKELVSIIIPAYNAEKYIKRCIDSVRNQTYRELQIIIVNDGSSDNTKSILEKYQSEDERVYVVHKENEGVSQARNDGLKYAKGEFIYFIDSDDYIDNHMIEKLITQQKKENSQFSVCGFINDYEDYKEPWQVSFNKTVVDKEVYLEKMSQYLYSVYFGALWNKLYRHDIIAENHLQFQRDISLAEDFIFNLQYLEYVEKISIIPECLYYYYQGNNESLTKRKSPWYLWNMAEIRLTYCIEQYKKMQVYDKCSAHIDTAIANELVAPTYSVVKEEKKPFKVARKMLQELYTKDIVVQAVMNTENPQAVHKIARLSLKYNNFSLFVILMKLWVYVQRGYKLFKK